MLQECVHCLLCVTVSTVREEKNTKAKNDTIIIEKNGNMSHLSNEVVHNETKKLSLSFTLIFEDTKFCEDFSFQCMGTLRLS